MKRAARAALLALLMATTACASVDAVAVPEPVAADSDGAIAHYLRVLDDITSTMSEVYPELVFHNRTERTSGHCTTRDGGPGRMVFLPIRASDEVLTDTQRGIVEGLFEVRVRAAGFHTKVVMSHSPRPVLRLFASDGSFVTLNGDRSAIVSLTIGCHPKS